MTEHEILCFVHAFPGQRNYIRVIACALLLSTSLVKLSSLLEIPILLPIIGIRQALDKTSR